MTSPQTRVRRAAAGDEPRLLATRVRALTDDPHAFGSTLEDERARTPEAWRRWIESGTVFLLEPVDHGDDTQGIVAGYFEPDEPGIVNLVSMWVAPVARGTGAADALIEALCGWAGEEGAREVRLHVVDDNARAIRVYERNGFRPTGRTFVRERDQALEIEMARPPGSA